MRTVNILLLVIGCFLCQAAFADTFYLNDPNVVGLCGPGGSCGTVDVTFAAGTVHVAVTVAPNFIFGNGATGAFGFNVNGTNTGVSVLNISPSPDFSLGTNGTGQNISSFGVFEYVINGPAQKIDQTLAFDVRRAGPNAFTSLADFYQANGANMFVAHIAVPGDPMVTGFVGTTTRRPPQEFVPEPSSLVLLGSAGLGVLAFVRKRLVARPF